MIMTSSDRPAPCSIPVTVGPMTGWAIASPSEDAAVSGATTPSDGTSASAVARMSRLDAPTSTR
jgi:hypothetical protein